MLKKPSFFVSFSFAIILSIFSAFYLEENKFNNKSEIRHSNIENNLYNQDFLKRAERKRQGSSNKIIRQSYHKKTL